MARDSPPRNVAQTSPSDGSPAPRARRRAHLTVRPLADLLHLFIALHAPRAPVLVTPRRYRGPALRRVRRSISRPVRVRRRRLRRRRRGRGVGGRIRVRSRHRAERRFRREYGRASTSRSEESGRASGVRAVASRRLRERAVNAVTTRCASRESDYIPTLIHTLSHCLRFKGGSRTLCSNDARSRRDERRGVRVQRSVERRALERFRRRERWILRHVLDEQI